MTTPGGTHGAPCTTGSLGIRDGSGDGSGATVATGAGAPPCGWGAGVDDATDVGLGDGDGLTTTPTVCTSTRPTGVCGTTAIRTPRTIAAAKPITTLYFFMTAVSTTLLLKCQARSSEITLVQRSASALTASVQAGLPSDAGGASGAESTPETTGIPAGQQLQLHSRTGTGGEGTSVHLACCIAYRQVGSCSCVVFPLQVAITTGKLADDQADHDRHHAPAHDELDHAAQVSRYSR